MVLALFCMKKGISTFLTTTTTGINQLAYASQSLQAVSYKLNYLNGKTECMGVGVKRSVKRNASLKRFFYFICHAISFEGVVRNASFHFQIHNLEQILFVTKQYYLTI